MADYATTDDLVALGVSTDVISDIDTAQQEAVISARSRFVDGFLRAANIVVPDGGLVAFTGDLTWAVVQLSVYDLVTNYHRYTTDKPNEDSLRKRHDDAIQWLQWMVEGKIGAPVPPEDEGSSVDLGAPSVVTSDIRGWTPRGL